MDTQSHAADGAPPVTLSATTVGAAAALPPAEPASPLEAHGAADPFGHVAILAPVANLIAGPDAGAPLTIGVFGAPGVGKSTALAWIARRVRNLAGKNKPAAPIVSFAVAGADLADSPAIAIADALRAALTGAAANAGVAPAFVVDALQAVVDPHEAAREAADRLDATRDRLEAERRALEDIETRRGRLLDSLLYENAGSSIDAFIRSRRAAIDARMRAFGFENDPVAAFKELSRQSAERNGALSAATTFLRALWAYKGQAALLVWAAFFVLLGELCRIGVENADAWLGALRNLGDQARPVADFIDAHLGWLESLRGLAWPLALLFVLLNVWRAIRFVTPIARGGRLLAADLAARRGQLENSIAHQTRRVDALSRDFENYADAAETARLRAERSHLAPASAAALSTDGATAAERARAFIAHVADAAARGEANAPRRFVAMIDGLESLAPERAVTAIVEGARLLSRDGIVTVIAADPRLVSSAAPGPAAAAEFLDRYFSLAVNLPDPARNPSAMMAYARSLVAGSGPAPAEAPPAPDDAPLDPVETALLASLAPLAAATPRAARRFVNLYRLARGRSADHAALALALALDSGATSVELAAVGAAMDAGAGDSPLAFSAGQERLAFALAAVNKARGAPLTIAPARQAWAIARDYRMPL